MTLEFNLKKTVQTINYFAQATSTKKIGKVKLFAMVYLADRYHLRKFGRMITNDNYFASENGPIASTVKNIIEQRAELTSDEDWYVGNFLQLPKKDQNIRSVEPVAMQMLSNSDIDTLEHIVENFSRIGRDDLSALTQQFTEWQKNSGKIQDGAAAKIDPMDFFLGTASEHEFADVTADDVAQSRALYKETMGL